MNPEFSNAFFRWENACKDAQGQPLRTGPRVTVHTYGGESRKRTAREPRGPLRSRQREDQDDGVPCWVPEGPAAEPSSAHKESSEAERWARSKSGRVEGLLAAQPQLQQQQADAAHSYRARLQQRLHGAEKSCRACDAQGLCQLERSQDVQVLALEFTVTVEAPVFRCQCCKQSSSPSPLEVGCYPGTPVLGWNVARAASGETPLWLDVSALRFFGHLRQVSKASVSCDCLASTLLAQYRDCPGSPPVSHDHVRKLLVAGLREFGYDNFGAEAAITSELPAYQQPLAECPACSHIAQHEKKIHSVNIDFDFKLVCLKKRGEAVGSPDNAHYFLPDKDVEAVSRDLPSGCQPVSVPNCTSEFRADKELGRKSARYAITALGLLVCRHGIILRASNCFTGERHAYALVFIRWLVCVLGLAVSYVWYDIACKWRPTLRWWAARQSPEVQALLADTESPLPPFHAKAHSLACQEQNAPMRFRGAGMPPGEPCEQNNAELKGCAALTKYNTRTRRQGILEGLIAALNLRKVQLQPELLLRMLVRTLDKRLAAREEERRWLQELRARGLTDLQVREQLAVLQQDGSSSASGPQRGEGAAYARAKLLMHWFPWQPNRALPDPSLLGQTSSSLEEAQRLVADSQFSAEPGTEEFEPLLLELVVEEARSAMRAIESSVCRMHALDLQMAGLAGNAKDQRRLQSHKQSEAGKARGRLTTLSAWLMPSQGAFVRAALLPLDVQLAQQAAQEAAQAGWREEEVLGGTFPWHTAAAAGPEGSLQVSLLLRRLRDAQQIDERCGEELQLVKKEQAAFLASCDQRIGEMQDLEVRLITEAAGLAGQVAAAAGAGGGAGSSELSPEEAALAEEARRLLNEKEALEEKLLLLRERQAALRTLRAPCRAAGVAPASGAGPSSGPSEEQITAAREAGQLMRQERVAKGKLALLCERLTALHSLRRAAAAAFAEEDPELGLDSVRFEAPLLELDDIYIEEEGDEQDDLESY